MTRLQRAAPPSRQHDTPGTVLPVVSRDAPASSAPDDPEEGAGDAQARGCPRLCHWVSPTSRSSGTWAACAGRVAVQPAGVLCHGPGPGAALTTFFLSVQFSRASLSSPACLAQEKTVSTALSPGSWRTLWVELGLIMSARGRQSFVWLRTVYPVKTKGSERFSLAGAPAFSVCVCPGK